MTTPQQLPTDYLNRVYAGVLGKIIGVYLGRPFEQWSHADIMAKLGEINGYVHEKLKHPLVVTDDDISGTFTFVKSVEDNDFPEHLTAADVGRTWLNYLIRNKTVLWWGGMGMSTEHTAYNRLVAGIEAPRSGSIEVNGPVVAEQIGAQIFIDSWGLINPGDPDRAAAMAAAAGSVSHDGEAIYGAQVVASLVAQSFVEKSLSTMLDRAVGQIPSGSLIARLIDDLRNCRAKHADWHKGLELIHEKWSYQHFGGGCHMVPNHAVVQLGLLWGEDDFRQALMIANTAGYDTDCNSGNVGCILGVKLGLPAINKSYDYRGPVADRILMPTADSGASVTDAVRESIRLVRVGARLRGKAFVEPKGGARWNFALPGSVQGFTAIEGVESCRLSNPNGEGLGIGFTATGGPIRVCTPVFFSKEETLREGYGIHGSPSAYPGQLVTATVRGGSEPAGNSVRLIARRYSEGDDLVAEFGPAVVVAPGVTAELALTLPDTGGYPYYDIGVEITPAGASARGSLVVDRMHVSGTPRFTLKMPDKVREHWMYQTKLWFKQWMEAADSFSWGDAKAHQLGQLAQDSGTGLALTGSRDWTDYRVSARLSCKVADRVLLCGRVGGLKRYYAAVLAGTSARRTLQIVKMRDVETVLAEVACPWELYTPIDVALELSGDRIMATALGVKLEARDGERPLRSGGIAVGVSAGRINVFSVDVGPVG